MARRGYPPEFRRRVLLGRLFAHYGEALRAALHEAETAILVS